MLVTETEINANAKIQKNTKRQGVITTIKRKHDRGY